MKNTLCIYHKGCVDGFGAAYVVAKAMGRKHVEFFEGIYQNEPPDCSGRDVVIVDDILDEGGTLAAILEYCREAGARSVSSCVLVDKKHDRGLSGLQGRFLWSRRRRPLPVRLRHGLQGLLA